uniref:Cytochrome P450 3201G3 n=1 Tax=Chamberlinius hualienensis TaxID=1551368 RepID=A0A1J1E3P5_9MYRI|nr:cytochrome P450 3201G3 [Chamberlinius hualienensis]
MDLSYVWSFIYSLIAVILVKWIIKRANIIVKLPPGPWGLPLVGYLPWIRKNAYESFIDISKKYGGLFSVNLGRETVVVLNDWKAVKATLLDQPNVFSGRPDMHLARYLVQKKDVTFSDGIAWKIQRKLTLQGFINIGLLNKSMENRILDLTQEVIEKLSLYNNKEAPMDSIFFSSILLTNWKLISVIPIDRNKLEEYEDAMNVIFFGLRPDNPINLFEWLRFIPPNRSGYKAFVNACDYVNNSLGEIVNIHLKNWEDGNAHDFIDRYIAEIKKKELNGQKAPAPFTIENLLGSLFNTFAAGVDTTNVTCLWAFLYLAYNQDSQKKAQKELDEVVGRFRMPSLDDFTKLPYIEAVIMEVHRKASLVPLAVPHRAIEDAKVFGYTIPKGTTCYPNIYAVHHDPTLWDDPQMFKPERFLDENNKVVWPPYLMPFSVGPRACLGQPLAQMELKLIISSLLHKFHFNFPVGQNLPTFDVDYSITLRPFPYSLLIKLREI